MKIMMYIDMPNTGYTDLKHTDLLATSRPYSPVTHGYTRYAFDVDLPSKHFGPTKYQLVDVGTPKEVEEVLDEDE